MLTSLLKQNPDLAEQLMLLAIDPARSAMTVMELLAPPRTKNYALVGTAFDYFLRWEIERRNPVAKDRTWVAEFALQTEAFSQMEPDLQRIYEALLKEAKAVHEEWIRTPVGPDDYSQMALRARVATTVICLAKMDPLYRTGTPDPLANRYDELDLADVLRLYSVTPWDQIVGDATRMPLLNPEFGAVSKLFRNADADLIVGDVLVDFKCTKNQDIYSYLAQLMGYLCCSELYRETEDQSFPVLNRAGILFCRHGKLVTFPLDMVRDHPDYDRVKALLFDTAKEKLWPDQSVSVMDLLTAFKRGSVLDAA